MDYKIGPLVLTQEQYQAARNSGHTLVVAGPGTGKTRTLLARAFHLLEEGIPSERILLLTFTLKTAQELRERLKALGAEVRVETFHALAYDLCREKGLRPRILEEKEREELIRELLKKKGFNPREARKVAEVFSLVSEGKNLPQEWQELYELYQKILRSEGLWDYERLLSESTGHSLEEEPLHLLIDEFQDLSPSLARFIKGFRRACFFLVGDPAQAIYGFRGGTPEVAQKFVFELSQTKILALTQSFRLPEKILTLAESLRVDPFGTPALKAVQKGGFIKGYAFCEAKAEAKGVAKLISELLGGLQMEAASLGLSPGEIAVLARVRAILPPLYEALKQAGIPVRDQGAEGVARLEEISRILEEGKDFKDLTRFEIYLDHLSASLKEQVKSILLSSRDVEEFLFRLSLLKTADLIAKDKYAVSLLTIHEAKGLEFQAVILVGAEEGLLPFTLMPEVNKEEEKRLAYVAVTRSAKQFYFTLAQRRFLFGRRLSGRVSPYFASCPLEKSLSKARQPKQKGLF